MLLCFFFSSRRRHTICALVTGVQTCALPIFEGTGYFNAEKPSDSHFQLTIQAASIDTRNADRDGHLKSNDFFDMETYPEITFASTAVEQTGDTEYRVTGDLTIKSVTKTSRSTSHQTAAPPPRPKTTT